MTLVQFVAFIAGIHVVDVVVVVTIQSARFQLTRPRIDKIERVVVLSRDRRCVFANLALALPRTTSSAPTATATRPLFITT